MNMKNTKKKINQIIFLLRILLVCLVLLGSTLIANHLYIVEKEKILLNEQIEQQKSEIERLKQEKEEQERLEKQEKEKKYQTCMLSPYQSESLQSEIDALEKEYEGWNLSFYVEDVVNEYTMNKTENTVYFGASVIKLVDVLYLINKAMAGEVDLSTTMTYESKHQYVYSEGMKNHKIGDEVPLKEIMEYAISVSDNTAHMMLLDYIGIENLRKFAESINVKTTISSSDKFGNLRAIDGYNILKEAYRILSLQNEYSYFLEDIMDSDYYNELNFDDVRFLHKYGYASRHYNEIGIYYQNENPYLVSIFTRYAYDDYSKIIGDLSKKIYNIYSKNYEAKKEYCLKEKENGV